MNKLLFMLITVTGVVSLHCMDNGSYYYSHPPKPLSPWNHMRPGYVEPSRQSKTKTNAREIKLSSIILPQIYRKLSELLHCEIAQYIVLLQLKVSNIDLAQFPLEIEQSCKDPKNLAQCIDRLIEACGYNLATELFKQFFSHEKSVCDVKNSDGNTVLHYAVLERYTEAVIKLLLDIDYNNTWTLLTMKDVSGWTALHYAADRDRPEIVTLLLHAAGDKEQDYKAMETNQGDSASYLIFCASLRSFSANLKKINGTMKKNNNNGACLIS